ncbi:MAG: ABC transporter substrate-binding protein [Acidimicrobiia bacterium]
MYLALVLALVLVACGDGTGSDTTVPGETTTPDTPPVETTAPETTPTETSAPATTAGNACAPESEVWFESGTLTVATGDPAFPPYVIDDDPTSGQGYESAVVYAVAENLGFAEEGVVWLRTTFDEAIAPGEKPYDFNIQQYSITDERDEVVDFSIPYYTSQKTLVALSESPAAGAATFADLQDVRFGATIGTTDLDYIVDVIGIPDADVAVYNDQAATFAALDAGQIDATVIGLPTALFITAVEMPQATIAGVLPRQGDEGDGMGMLFTDGSPAVDCVNAALQALIDDGTLAAIDEEWMQAGGDIPEITE